MSPNTNHKKPQIPLSWAAKHSVYFVCLGPGPEQHLTTAPTAVQGQSPESTDRELLSLPKFSGAG